MVNMLYLLYKFFFVFFFFVIKKKKKKKKIKKTRIVHQPKRNITDVIKQKNKPLQKYFAVSLLLCYVTVHHIKVIFS